MSGTSEPGMADERELGTGAELSRVVQIEQVQLVRAEAALDWKASDLWRRQEGVLATAVAHRATARQLDGHTIVVIAAFRFDAGPEDAGGQPPVHVLAEFALRYSMSEPGEATARALEEFAQSNGVYNAWPYWREYLQSTTARMGLPAFVLPVFRVETKPAPKPGRKRRATGR